MSFQSAQLEKHKTEAEDGNINELFLQSKCTYRLDPLSLRQNFSS